MSFPPPIRFSAPLLALFFGLIATWFDYRLNLDLDLARHLDEVRESAEGNGRRLARMSEKLLATGQRELVQSDVEGMADLPALEVVAVVGENGRVLADSTGTLHGQPAAEGILAEAAALIGATSDPAARHSEDADTLVRAHPFRLPEGKTGWVLVKFDRTLAIAAAQSDARTQLIWLASAMALLSFGLWAALHFGFATRLMRLAGSMHAYGEGQKDVPVALSGSDEVGVLSVAFSTMREKLREREREQLRLENEVLEISEREKQRIGHDLHDGLGQRLTAASMAANAAVAAAQVEAPAHAARVSEIGQQLREAIAETRALSHGLAPVGLKDDGLANALHILVTDTGRVTGVRCVLECVQPVRMPDTSVATHLYRIAQEAVNNALKYAEPGEIRIGLENRDNSLVLEVDDDGTGLPETVAAGGGIGMRVMRHRAELMGGSFEIGSPPAGGTRISCQVTLTV